LQAGSGEGVAHFVNPIPSDDPVPEPRRPGRNEADAEAFPYIDRITADDVLVVLSEQLKRGPTFFLTFSEENSLHRYAADKWSIRQVLNHVNDAERILLSRALWFARGFQSALPSYDQVAASAAAEADSHSWIRHVAEFRAVRMASLTFFENLPAKSWDSHGIASDRPFTVRALAYLIAGHLDHHCALLSEQY
jgi:hypothetical protein